MVSHFLSWADPRLTGPVLYQGFESFWPTEAKSTNYPKDLIEFAHWMETRSKDVFSQTLTQLSRANSRLAEAKPEETAKKLKEQKS